MPTALLRLADLQSGVVTREQARASGVSDAVIARLLRDRWRRVARGVYLTNPIPPTWESLAWAGVLVGGDAARLGPHASGWLHGLLPTAPSPIDILTPRASHPRPREAWIFQRERDGSRASRSVGSPPRLGVEDTILDLAGGSEGELIAVIAEALHRRLTTSARLREALSGRARHPHRALLVSVLDEIELGSRSLLEVRYRRDVEVAHGLPRARRQRSVGRQSHHTDVDYAEFMTLVELDGRVGHTGRSAFKDLDRDNVHAILGRVTLRYGWFDVCEQPCRVAAQVAQALVARGWRGAPQRCPACRRLPDEYWDALSGVVQ